MASQSYVQFSIAALVFSRANDRIIFLCEAFSPHCFHQKGEETKRGDILVKQNFQAMPPMIDKKLFFSVPDDSDDDADASVSAAIG